MSIRNMLRGIPRDADGYDNVVTLPAPSLTDIEAELILIADELRDLEAEADRIKDRYEAASRRRDAARARLSDRIAAIGGVIEFHGDR
jgi:hypothetical protein